MRIHAKGREGVVEIGLCFEASQKESSISPFIIEDL